MKGGATISLSVALALGVFACAPVARAVNSPDSGRSNMSANSGSAKAQQEAAKMVTATVHLKKGLDARKVHQGDSFQAVVQHDVQLKNGPKLDDGTLLMGKVTEDSTGHNHSRLALRFTQAKLRNGQTVPIEATVIQLAQPEGPVGSGTNLANQSGLWTPHTLRVDQVGAISGADLHSAIGSGNSAVLVSKKDDIKLHTGDQLEVVIAVRGHHSASDMRGGA